MMSVQVVVLDALAVVPYYVGHLCAALASAGNMRVWPATITYHHDPECFSHLGLRPDPGLVNFAWRAPALLRRPAKLAEYLLNLAALLIRFAIRRPDVLHVQFLPLLRWACPLERWFLRAVRALGVTIVYTVHNLLPQDTGGRRRETYRRVYQSAARLVCHDEETARRLAAEFGIPGHRIAVIPHGPLFEEDGAPAPGVVRARLGLPSDGCVFLWHGILRPYKGVSFLLRAWREVCARYPHARLVIAGSGDPSLARQVIHETAELDLGGSVRLDLRFLSRRELSDYFAAADVLVYPYQEITTSGALMTGLVRGKAVVATQLPAFEQMLAGGENALLVPCGDVSALADALCRLAASAGLRSRLARNLQAAQARLPRWDDIALRTRDCYLDALAGERRAAQASGLVKAER
jgi:glycosyltransferase involved in cell wall biosynthesis